MATSEDKFIVINLKHLDECNAASKLGHGQDCSAVKALKEDIETFREVYKAYTGKSLDQKYLVCNQDEPYAKDVQAIILSGEDAKQS